MRDHTGRRLPFANAVIRDWRNDDGSTARCVAVLGAIGPIAAVLDPGEARALADQLHDAADRLEQETYR